MTEIAYNNTKNTSTGHTHFELSCGYQPKVSFKEDVDSRSRSRFANKLVEELRELKEVCCQNFFYVQKLQKKTHDKGVNSHSYVLDKKIWLNSKYIKTMKNKKLESKFFGPFRVLYAIENQAYKLELATKWKIHNIFYMSLLE